VCSPRTRTLTLRVALNLLHLVPRETGGGELYARRLIPALLEDPRQPDLTVVVGREAHGELTAEPWARDVRLVALPVASRSRLARVAAEQALLPVAVRSRRAELLHNLFTTAPAAAGLPQVTTILDVIYKRFPETHSGLLSLGMRALVPLAARRSRRILTLSEASKDDIVRFLGVPADRVDVTYLGPGMPNGIKPLAEPELRRRLGIGGEPIVLTVSAKRPHKNLERLIDAMARLAEPAVLVVPGYATGFEASLRRHADVVAPGRVRFTGWVDEDALEGLYRAATCFVFPSLAEGFGLPLLEALQRGVPVACSNASSLPEIAGDAARYFDPYDTGAIATAIEQLLRDGALRGQLADAGRRRGDRFSWTETARQTIDSYARTLGR
jgi:glycosyltransferase involved in cell wall biosynthesis